MNLAKRKMLAAKVLGVGRSRIVFVAGQESRIKDAISRQDILDLHKDGTISIKEVSGRRINIKRKNRRKTGKVKKKVNKRKAEYVIITRKLRGVVRGLFRMGKIGNDKRKELRKQVRARKFRSKRHLKESLEE
jgi:large subunit ribosomal protein L19e